jgi:Flp pilus assembly protein TadD
MAGANPDLEAGMRMYREARFREALAHFERALQADANDARARGMRGFAFSRLGDMDAAVRDLGAAVEREPRDAMLQTGLGMVLLVLDRLDEAEAALRRALALAPNDPDALANLSLALRLRGDFAGAERAARNALATRPRQVEARVNLAYALLAQGKYAEGWEAHSARPDPRLNPRSPASPAVVPHDAALPAAGAPVILHGEQGLGDILFFLRFAHRLKERGHPLAFWGDPRLHGLLGRTGLFQHFLKPEAVPGAGIAVIWVGDLPHLVRAVDPAAFDPPLAIPVDAARRERWRERLAAWGPPPYVGLTWRAGIERRGSLGLSKQVDPVALGDALKGKVATWVSLQRNPSAGEVRLLSGALGAPVHDAASANDDLDEVLALVDLLDEYVAVSNTNTHLRAAAGRDADVLVPWPPEWRWLADVERSPWFAAMRLYRQARDGDWRAALAAVRARLQAP